MRSSATASLLAILVSVSFIPLSAHAATKTWIKVDGIPGESLDAHHEGEIDLLSYSQAFGTKNCSRVVVAKLLDKASPGLIGAAIGNVIIPNVVITMQKVGPNPFNFLKATLGTVLIERVDLTDETGELREQLVLKPQRIRIEYTPQRADGSPGQVVTTDLVCT